MEAIAQDESINKRKRKFRDRVSTAELFTALEGLLPAAEIEIDWLASYVKDFPDDEDHAEDAGLVRQGQEAIELAKRLIARKSPVIRRKQRVLTAQENKADA